MLILFKSHTMSICLFECMSLKKSHRQQYLGTFKRNITRIFSQKLETWSASVVKCFFWFSIDKVEAYLVGLNVPVQLLCTLALIQLILLRYCFSSFPLLTSILFWHKPFKWYLVLWQTIPVSLLAVGCVKRFYSHPSIYPSMHCLS